MKNAPDLAGAPVIPNLNRSVRASKVWEFPKSLYSEFSFFTAK